MRASDFLIRFAVSLSPPTLSRGPSDTDDAQESPVKGSSSAARSKGKVRLFEGCTRQALT